MKEKFIGSYIWMTENLGVSCFRNGDLIPEAKSSIEWVELCNGEKPAWCYYTYDDSNGMKFGKLYNWYAVNDPRNLAPKGWHIPSEAEWNDLIENLSEDGDDPSLSLKSIECWNENEGNNSSGFNAVPSGKVDMFGVFDYSDDDDFNQKSSYWSSSEEGVGGGQLLAGNKEFARFREIDAFGISSGKCNKKCGLSVRCVKG
jgi:uncharacterized protein (TIGR02145 family)